MEYGSSIKAKSLSENQGIYRVLWTSKAHYNVHKSSPLVPTLIHINSFDIKISYFSMIHFSIISTLHLGLRNGFFPSGFPTQPVCIPQPFHACYMLSESPVFLFDHM
jgi:hypothetical protein